MSLTSAPTTTSPLGRHRLLSPSCSLKVSPLCLGTMNFGEVWSSLMGECNKATTFSILDQFYSSGGNFIDTANMYMLGESEAWLGEWMAARGVRDEMVVGTKYSIPITAPNETKILSNYGGNNKKSLRLSLEASLKRLQTDYVDILYVHCWEGTTSIEELMRSLDDVVRAGKALYLGVSNWPAWLVAKANAYARAHGLSTFVVYQGRWNAADRDIEREVVPMCKAEGMGITVWGAMGGGKFKRAEERERTGIDDRSGSNPEAFERVFEKLEKVGESTGLSTMGVALRYVMLKAPYVFPVCGGRKIEHLKSNIDALTIDLSQQDIEEIESGSPFNLGYPHITLSGSPNKQISTANPAFCVAMCCSFDGVEEVKAIRSSEFEMPVAENGRLEVN